MAIRLLSKKEVRARVLYSPAQIDRLEKAGLFPKRVQLGPCRDGSRRKDAHVVSPQL